MIMPYNGKKVKEKTYILFMKELGLMSLIW